MRTLTRDEILGYISLLAGAGNETTTRLIGWTGKLLAEHPDQRKELVDEPALIPNAIEELLRYEPPSPVQARYVTKDVEHYGQTVPAGASCLLLNGSANRDERQFEDPDRFDIHRKIERHLSFGYGIHFCLGAHLARLEARVALEEVLQAVPGVGGRLRQRRAGPHLHRARLGEDARPYHVSEANVVLTEVVDRTLVITLNRPAVRNAFDSQLSLGVLDAFRALDADPELRVGILTGSGGSFCAGMDLKAFARDGLPEKIDTVLHYGCRKPLIAAIEGIAVGGGLELALTADLLVASTDARFGSPEVKFGLFPAGGALLRLPRHLPQSLVTEMSLTGELISAQTAFERGLIARLCETGKTLDTALELAGAIARNAPLGVDASLQLLRRAPGRTEDELWEEQLELVDSVVPLPGRPGGRPLLHREAATGMDRALGRVRTEGPGRFPHRRPQPRAGLLQPAADHGVEVVELRLEDVQAAGGQGGAELHQDGPQVDLDGQRVLRAGAHHERHHGDAAQVGGAEPVEEGLEQSGVARLVGGRGHHGEGAAAHGGHGVLHGRRGPVEELGAEIGEVNRHVLGGGQADRVGRGRGDRIGHTQRARAGLGVADDDADRAHA